MNFAVIDTETNWYDEVMSIGIIISQDRGMEEGEGRYYIIDPEYKKGGMFSAALPPKRGQQSRVCTRREALEDIKALLEANSVKRLFAYNAPFDCRHLPELGKFSWYDIMRIAAYRQYNPCIGPEACCCSTGRLKSGYGVEPMLRLLSGERGYNESHNALEDASDELKIMRLLRLRLSNYSIAKIR